MHAQTRTRQSLAARVVILHAIAAVNRMSSNTPHCWGLGEGGAWHHVGAAEWGAAEWRAGTSRPTAAMYAKTRAAALYVDIGERRGAPWCGEVRPGYLRKGLRKFSEGS